MRSNCPGCGRQREVRPRDAGSRCIECKNKTGWAAVDQGDWADSALCAQTDNAEAFFPPIGGDSRAAKAVCARCEVRLECLQWALDNREQFGIFGGMSANQRLKILRRRAA